MDRAERQTYYGKESSRHWLWWRHSLGKHGATRRRSKQELISRKRLLVSPACIYWKVENQVDYRNISAEALAEQNPCTYDIVTCMEMLEHVPSPASVISACSALVKPGGHVFFSTLNRNPKSYLFAVVGAEYVLNLLPKGTHDYAKFIKPSELTRWAKSVGLEPDELIGMSYNPFNQHYRLGHDTSVNYLVHTRKTR